MPTINMHDAKTQLSDLVARAEAGEEIIIARRNKPAVKLVPTETADRQHQVGFAEDNQAEFDLAGLRAAVQAGREFTIMQDGKEVAKVSPQSKKGVGGFGMLAHLPPVPDEFFFDPLPDDELDAWEGKYSSAEDNGKQ